MSHVHRLAYEAGKGLYVEVPCNFGLDTNERINIYVLLDGARVQALSDDALNLLGRPIRKWIGRNLATFRGPGPRVIPLDELH